MSRWSRWTRRVCGRAWQLTLTAALVLPWIAATAGAAPRTLESVGAVGVVEGDRRDPKQRAVEAALREAVWRVAEELLVDAILIEDLEGDEDAALTAPDLAEILGNDMVRYTARFKVLEDRGLGPVLFVEDPGVSTEYVVVAEVVVEADRIRERLTRAGLLEPESFASQVGTIHLEVEGLSVYPALSELRELLIGPVGAQTAVPVRFERGRALLAVGTALSGPDLISELERRAPDHLAIVPLAASGGRARIAVRWTPPIEESPAGGALPPVQTGIPAWARP
jgi:hypothetical protein